MARTKKAKKTAKKTVRKAVTKKTKKTVARAAPKRTAKAGKTAKAAKPAAKAVPTPANTPLKDTFNKSQILNYIADYSAVPKKEVGQVLDLLAHLMGRQLCKGGAGEFVVPGLMKCVVKRKPATKARKGINPFTGAEIMIKAKPARNVVKIRPLKRLKSMVED